MGKLSPSYRFPFDEDRIKSKEKQELADYLKDLVKSLRNMWDELYRAINTVLSLPNTIAKVLTDHDKATHDALGIDHGSLDGLADDDHVQYHNDARGDIRYYTQAQVDALLATKGFFDRGDPAASDWTVGDFTTDGNWHNLDCSGIVSAGAKAIVFAVSISDNLVGAYFLMRKDGNVNEININPVRTQVTNIPNDAVFTVPCSAARIVEYKGFNTAFTAINVCIAGWFI